MKPYLEIVITAEDRERGKSRMIEDALPVIKRHYEAAVRKCPEGTIRITLDFEGKGPYG